MKDISGKSVLVTGASTGIGNSVAVYLAKKGYLVFATVRKSSDVEKLNALKMRNLRPVYPLDLRLPDQVLSAADSIIEMTKVNLFPKLKTQNVGFE